MIRASRVTGQRRPITPPPYDPSTLSSRRDALRVAVTATAAAMVSWLSLSPKEAAARRNACHVRCGGDRRLCRNDCRDEGEAERPCKRACNLLRDACFERCDYRPLRFRLARG